MPLPIIIGIAAAVAGLAGVGSGISGGVKMKNANDTMKSAERMKERAESRVEEQNQITLEKMDALGKYEMEILNSFERFSNAFEKIKNRPDFKNLNLEKYNIPEFDHEEIQKIYLGASVLLGGLGGAALGTAGGFAAAGATTAAVMAVGTASTGTAIASLSGVAATNATLAALGGGAIAAGGGGMALGSAILGGATLGVGLLVGGIIFNITGSGLSNKADEAMSEAREIRRKADKICDYLEELYSYAEKYLNSLKSVNDIYLYKLETLEKIIMRERDYNKFSKDEKTLTNNMVLLVGLLNKMCKVNLVIKDTDNDELNEVNKNEVDNNISDANDVLSHIA